MEAPTYTVNGDCKGTAEIDFTDGSPPIHLSMVVFRRGREILNVSARNRTRLSNEPRGAATAALPVRLRSWGARFLSPIPSAYSFTNHQTPTSASVPPCNRPPFPIERKIRPSVIGAAALHTSIAFFTQAGIGTVRFRPPFAPWIMLLARDSGRASPESLLWIPYGAGRAQCQIRRAVCPSRGYRVPRSLNIGRWSVSTGMKKSYRPYHKGRYVIPTNQLAPGSLAVVTLQVI
jgi:hypothetical protein